MERSSDSRGSPFSDHFSDRAEVYAAYRPHYPPEIVDFLAAVAGGEKRCGTSGLVDAPVWEAGCGSGQLTCGLAGRFSRIVATDASPDQLSRAKPHPHVDFRVARAEESGLASGSIDLAVSAQAAHWFDLGAYYDEVRRVARPAGHLALIVYGMHTCADPKIDAWIKHFYHETLGPYWPAQRRLVEEEYRTLPFPFHEIPSPRFEMRAEWDLEGVLGYVESWSATAALRKSGGGAQVDEFREKLCVSWGKPAARMMIRWPLSMRLGIV